MDRRKFLKRTLPAATIIPGLVDGFSMSAVAADHPLLRSVLSRFVDTENVLVIVQLSGGNDGLNTVIPISEYSDYVNARKNVAIAENRILKLDGAEKTGLHPSMTGFQQLYNEGKLNIVQSVGYPIPNFSHFRATDIWMSASDSNQTVNSGWIGRYLDEEYPGFPNNYPTPQMPDPLAIQIGSVTTLTCQGPAVSMGMSITDPTSFYNLIDNIQDPVPNTPMGIELSYVRQVAKATNKYSDRIRQAALAVTTQGNYPANNSLAAQLKIVARLIKGGLKTRVYMVSFGGFDTHANQVVAADTATGAHANLLGAVSSAVKAFMDDCKGLGVQERVIGMTFSEFGRRIKSNASGGTDHGSAAPLFLFGKNVFGGVTGTNPDIPSNITVGDNIPFQYDFRSVYASVLEQWFCLSNDVLQQVMLKNFQSLPLINNSKCAGSRPNGFNNDNVLIFNYPNPFSSSTNVVFKTKGGHTLVQVIDSSGKLIKTLLERTYTEPGTQKVIFDSEGLPFGIYYLRLQNGPVQQVKAMMKVR